MIKDERFARRFDSLFDAVEETCQRATRLLDEYRTQGAHNQRSKSAAEQSIQSLCRACGTTYDRRRDSCRSCGSSMVEQITRRATDLHPDMVENPTDSRRRKPRN